MQLSSSTPATGDRAKDVEHFDDILRTFIHETDKVRGPRRQHQRRGENDGSQEAGAGKLTERQVSSHHNDVRRADRRLEEHHSLDIGMAAQGESDETKDEEEQRIARHDVSNVRTLHNLAPTKFVASKGERHEGEDGSLQNK